MRRLTQLIGILLWIRESIAQTEPGTCEEGSSEIGYATITDVNFAMQAEVAKIQGGQPPQTDYTFNLCSKKVYDTEAESLKPILSNSFVVCGPDGKSNNQCTFLGGNIQVEINDSALPSYPLTEVTISGITFADFKQTAVAAFASSSTSLNLMDVVFTGFNAESAIKQGNGTVTDAMGVTITNCAANSGTVGSLFANDGGQLTVSNLIVGDLDAGSLISTSNGGTSFLQDSTIRESAMDSISATSSTGAQTVMGVEVSQMRRLLEAFLVSDPQSMLTITTASITQNNLTASTWSGVVVRQGATALVDELEISSNSGVEFGVSVSSAGTSLTMSNSFLRQNQGTATSGVSASAISLSSSTLSIDRTEFNGNQGFSAEVLALLAASLSLTQSCIQDGSATFVVFVDQTSSYTSSFNYINNYQSERCPAADPTLRLFKESPGSGCFIGSNVCEGTCEQVADQTECLAQTVPTVQPVPTQSPRPVTALPTTAAPVTPPPSGQPTLRPNTLAPTQKAPTPLIPHQPTIQPSNLCPGKSKKGKSKKSKSKKGKVPPLPPPPKGMGKGKGGMSKGGMMGMSCGKGMGKGRMGVGMSKGGGGSSKSSGGKGKGKGGDSSTKTGSAKSYYAPSSKSYYYVSTKSAMDVPLRVLSERRDQRLVHQERDDSVSDQKRWLPLQGRHTRTLRRDLRGVQFVDPLREWGIL